MSDTSPRRPETLDLYIAYASKFIWQNIAQCPVTEAEKLQQLPVTAATCWFYDFTGFNYSGIIENITCSLSLFLKENTEVNIDRDFSQLASAMLNVENEIFPTNVGKYFYLWNVFKRITVFDLILNVTDGVKKLSFKSHLDSEFCKVCHFHK